MRPANDDGFILVEAIAALGVAALAAAALIGALGAANARSAEAQVRSVALRQAEVLILEATQSPEPDQLDLKGNILNPKLSWTRALTEPNPALPGLQKIVVEVTWQSFQKKGVTRLEAYRVAPT